MPIVDITLIEGYDEQTKLRLSERVTDATTSVIKAPAELVTVLIRETPPTNYMRGRINRRPGPACAVQSDIVKAYLNAMEQRDLDGAQQYLAPNFKMIFPGGATFSNPQQLVEWAADRYQSISKTIEHFNECFNAGESVVYCFGTLQGVWPDGQNFSGIRFIDRFLLTDNLIVEQHVWNDLAERRMQLEATQS